MKLSSLLIFIATLIFAFESYGAKAIIDYKTPRSQLIKDYLKLQGAFSKQVCNKREDHKYWDLLKDYRGEGYFIPTNLEGDHLDIEAIEKNKELMTNKITWIADQIKKVHLVKSFKPSFTLIREMKKQLKEIVEIKYLHSIEKSKNKRELVFLRSETKLKELSEKFRELLYLNSFLLSYSFPVDHLELRKISEVLNTKKELSEEDKKLKNEIFLKRKILQDGTHDPKNKKQDKYFRAMLDTVSLGMIESRGTISEKLRYDLEDALDSFERYLGKGIKYWGQRLTNWHSRSKDFLNFYDQLLDKKGDGVQAESKKAQAMLKQKSKASFLIKEFNAKKQREVFLFWRNHEPIMKALFSIETILFNEVGSFDGPYGLERNYVTQVVLNRYSHPHYNFLNKDGVLYEKLLDVLSDDEIAKEKWLNVLFKTGEFSFTYFFIPGSAHIYCPDMSKRGKHLRRQNLLKALKFLKEPMEYFDAVRYFSRAAMLGRVDMSVLWSNNFLPLPEEPGRKAKGARILQRYYRKGQFTYLYSFQDYQGRTFKVLKIRDKHFVLYEDRKDMKFYEYRNVHFFRYFKEINPV